MSEAVWFITAEALCSVGRTMRFLTRSTHCRILLAQQISAVGTGLDVFFAHALSARVTGDGMGTTVWLLVDSARRLIGLAEDVVTSHTGSAVSLTDEFTALIAGFQMFRCEQGFAVNTFRCMVQTTDFAGVVSGD